MTVMKPVVTNVPDTLRAVLNTLNQVTVSGKTNLDRILGSIVAVENCIAELEKEDKDDHD